ARTEPGTIVARKSGSDTPAQQYGSDREPRADRREQYQIPLLEPSRAHGVVERERNRCRRRVAESIDVDDDLVLIDAELFGRRLDDAAVRLVRHEEVEVVRLEPVARENPLRDLLGLSDGELEDGLAVLLHVVKALVDRVVARRLAAAAGRHAQRRTARAVD